MFIFNRSTTLNRNRMMEATMASVEVAALVTKITGIDVNVFATRYGEAGNTIAWTCRLDSQDELEVANAKLMANEEYLAWAGSNNEMFETAPHDRLSSIISSTLTPEVKRYYTVLTAQAANGRLGAAMEFGVRAQQLVAEKTGLATAFMAGVYGPFGTVGWITGGASMADIDKLWDMQMNDTDYHALVGEAGDLFLTGSGTTMLIEKIN